MGLKSGLASAVGKTSTWALRRVFNRPAGNLPGKIALKIDPSLIQHLRSKIQDGTIVVVGTNGKTSVNNLIADMMEDAGYSIICNRTGANLATGVASTLLQAKPAQWGVFESDELWLAKTLPALKADYVVLLNLFRDQLDRCGEISRIQDTIAAALEASPETTLIYNADDPLCAIIADKVSNRSVSFGIDESLGLEQNTVSDAQMCQQCAGMISYHYRQYGQLGDYYCDSCSFKRPPLTYGAFDVNLTPTGATFKVKNRAGEVIDLRTYQGTPYLIYNLLAAFALSDCLGIDPADLKKAMAEFDPQNGRLQSYEIGDHPVLLNLAKNPTGFNQNLRLAHQDHDPKAVAFFINDKVADGHDISWIWDIDFEELASHEDTQVFAGGIRKNDLQVRLKYAGIEATLIDDVSEVLAHVHNQAKDSDAEPLKVYAIANYTALPPVKSSLDKLRDASAQDLDSLKLPQAPVPEAPATPETSSADADPLVITHLLPDLLNLYGDGGNIRVLEKRCQWRGIPVEVRRCHYGEPVDLDTTDILFMGGGPDREQKLASEELIKMRDALKDYVEDDGVVLAICGGYQILGTKWLLGEELVEGLHIVDIETRRPGTSADRLIENMVLDSPWSDRAVVGYENHAGRTFLGPDVQPFGAVISSVGHGNNDEDKADGALYKNVLGTYSHGPLLSKNPEIADELIRRGLKRNHQRNDRADSSVPENLSLDLTPLNDQVEIAANEYMCHRLGVSHGMNQ